MDEIQFNTISGLVWFILIADQPRDFLPRHGRRRAQLPLGIVQLSEAEERRLPMLNMSIQHLC